MISGFSVSAATAMPDIRAPPPNLRCRGCSLACGANDLALIRDGCGRNQDHCARPFVSGPSLGVFSSTSGCENGFRANPRHCAPPPPGTLGKLVQFQTFRVRSVNCFRGPDWFGGKLTYTPLELLGWEPGGGCAGGRSITPPVELLLMLIRQVADSK